MAYTFATHKAGGLPGLAQRSTLLHSGSPPDYHRYAVAPWPSCSCARPSGNSRKGTSEKIALINRTVPSAPTSNFQLPSLYSPAASGGFSELERQKSATAAARSAPNTNPADVQGVLKTVSV